jgi:hypothetical protein
MTALLPRLWYALDSGGHVLVERRAREPIAMLTCCELIRCDAVLEFLTFAIRIPEPVPIELQKTPDAREFRSIR